MSGNFYDNPVEVTYSLPAVDVSAAGTTKVRGPAARAGRIRAATYRVATAVTVADAEVTVGSNGAPVALTLAVPVGAVNDTGTAPKADVEAATELLADTDVDIVRDGASTAGAIDLFLTIGWF